MDVGCDAAFAYSRSGAHWAPLIHDLFTLTHPKESAMSLADRTTLAAPRAPTAERFTPRQVRVLGAMLIVIGSLLVVGMVATLYSLGPTLLRPGQLIGGERFTGTAEQARQVLSLLISVAISGLVFAGVGAHQCSTGRRNPWLLALAGLAIAVVVFLGWQTLSILR
jgi:hypothetical protein